ncbi:MAG: hypothetical protein ACTSSG_06550 [Candidatus Heimdallarchaeaceae archaeon]
MKQRNWSNFLKFTLLSIALFAFYPHTVLSLYQTKVADVTIDFSNVELAKDGDIDYPWQDKGEIHLWIKDPFGLEKDWDLGKHITLEEWNPDISKTWTRVFFDVVPKWEIRIYDKDLLDSDILFTAVLNVFEYGGTGTKYVNNKENFGIEIASWNIARHEEAGNDFIGAYCEYLWEVGKTDLNTFYVWVSNPPDYSASSARLTISITIDYYWWNIW